MGHIITCDLSKGNLNFKLIYKIIALDFVKLQQLLHFGAVIILNI